jgi:hypothetical protein
MRAARARDLQRGGLQQGEAFMIARILIALGLRSAPAPLRSYLTASSFVGVVPALAFVAWKYRRKIAPMLRRAPSSQPQPQGV